MNETLHETMQGFGGMISAKQALDAGISRQTLTNYVRSGKIERVGSGIYILPDTIEDDMYAVSLRSKWIVFSHDTALFLNRLAERTPFAHSVTVPSTASVPKSIKQYCNCFYVKPELHQLGVTVRKTTFGHEVRCYDSERTICDLVRSRSRYSVELVTDAIKAYANSNEKDLNRLSEYAEQFHVVKALKPYLEVLL